MTKKRKQTNPRDAWMEVKVKLLRKAIEVYFAQIEKQYAIYRSWWPEMLQAYKESCRGSGDCAVWYFAEQKRRFLAENEKKNSQNGISGKRV